MARVCLGNIKGPKGDPGPAGPAGPQGEPGNTPVKGVDYFTEEEIRSIKEGYVAANGGIESTDHPGCYYRTMDGEVEWINPPMELGVEYRTTERFMGKIVYRQAVHCGSMPNTAEKLISYSTPSGEISTAIRCWGYSSKGHTIPYISDYAQIYLYASDEGIGIKTSKDQSQYNAVVVVEYTKKVNGL